MIDDDNFSLLLSKLDLLLQNKLQNVMTVSHKCSYLIELIESLTHISNIKQLLQNNNCIEKSADILKSVNDDATSQDSCFTTSVVAPPTNEIDELDHILNKAKILRESKTKIKASSNKIICISKSNTTSTSSKKASLSSSSSLLSVSKTSIKKASSTSSSSNILFQNSKINKPYSASSNSSFTSTKSSSSTSLTSSTPREKSISKTLQETKSQSARSRTDSKSTSTTQKQTPTEIMQEITQQEEEQRQEMVNQRIIRLKNQLKKIHNKHYSYHNGNSGNANITQSSGSYELLIPALLRNNVAISTSQPLLSFSTTREKIMTPRKSVNGAEVTPRHQEIKDKHNSDINQQCMIMQSPLYMAIKFYDILTTSCSNNNNNNISIIHSVDETNKSSNYFHRKQSFLLKLKHIKQQLLVLRSEYQTMSSQFFYNKDRKVYTEREHDILSKLWLKYQVTLYNFKLMQIEWNKLCNIHSSNGSIDERKSDSKYKLISTKSTVYDNDNENDKKYKSQTDISYVLNIIDLLPCMTPFHFHNTISNSSVFTSPTSRAHTKQLQQQQQQQPKLDLMKSLHSSLTNHHRNLKILVEYVIELLIARYCLPNVIQELKQCCKETLLVKQKLEKIGLIESDMLYQINLETINKWKNALIYFKNVYNCLLYKGQDTSCCLFFEN